MTHTTLTDDEICTRVFEILAREGRAIHTGELALLLQVATHQVHTAMHHPYQAGKVYFVSSEGWSLPAAQKREAADGQSRIV